MKGLDNNSTAEESSDTLSSPSSTTKLPSPSSGSKNQTTPASPTAATPTKSASKKPNRNAKDLQREHFNDSPFKDAAQLNQFLMYFGIVSALLIMAFMIQCCREIARGDETTT